MLNFSLDTIDESIYNQITGNDNFQSLIHSIIYCARLLPVKINTVVMKDINNNGIFDIISFCESHQIRNLKLLDIIEDLNSKYLGNLASEKYCNVRDLKDLYMPLSELSQLLRKIAISEKIVYQGNLGHPMNEFVLKSGLRITVKDANNGAWYGIICKKCPYYPCHDALMALRLTPDSNLQYCLLNSDYRFSLKNLSRNEIEQIVANTLSLYRDAKFESCK